MARDAFEGADRQVEVASLDLLKVSLDDAKVRGERRLGEVSFGSEFGDSAPEVVQKPTNPR